jgi:hypothetical protein
MEMAQQKRSRSGGNPHGFKRKNAMHEVVRRATVRKRRSLYDPNNVRMRELSRLARDLFPDSHGDYVLPDTVVGYHLAIALITHLTLGGPRNANWLTNFCAARVPWLDPDEIDITELWPDRAQALGRTASKAAHHHHCAVRSDARRAKRVGAGSSAPA